jgi:hypothetical protein
MPKFPCPNFSNPFMLSSRRAQVVPRRSSVVSCAICGSARASASAPAAPIVFPASRPHRITPLRTVRRPHTTSALTVPTPAEQRPNKQLRKAMPKPRQPVHAIKPQSAGEFGHTTEIERRQVCHLRQRPRQRCRARGSNLVPCKPPRPQNDPPHRSPPAFTVRPGLSDNCEPNERPASQSQSCCIPIHAIQEASAGKVVLLQVPLPLDKYGTFGMLTSPKSFPARHSYHSRPSAPFAARLKRATTQFPQPQKRERTNDQSAPTPKL